MSGRTALDHPSIASVSRRRFIAVLGALGLQPGIARAQGKSETWTCGVGRPTSAGFHQLTYHLTDGNATHVSATMRFDLTGHDWTTADLAVNGRDTRGFEADLYLRVGQSAWSVQMQSDLARRRKALERLPQGDEREALTRQLEYLNASVFLASTGWLDLHLRNPPGRNDTLAPEAIELQFPPLGSAVGLSVAQIVIEGFTQDGTGAWDQDSTSTRKLGSWTYETSGADGDIAGAGPAPRFRETDPQRLQQIVGLLGARKPLLFRALDPNGTALFELVLESGYDWQEEYAVLGTLIPDAQSAARALANGQYDDYRAQFGDRGGVCEKSACFLSTAAVDAMGLTDDCWELATLRRFRDGWLSRQPFGAALIAEYYRSAPWLVERINARADARRVWQRTYLLGVAPAALAAHFGRKRLALALYRRMAARLSRLADRR